MEFRVSQDPNAFCHTIECRYRDMLGNDKVLCRSIPHADLINGGPAGEVLEFIKHRMRTEISHELGDQAVQVQEQQVMPYYQAVTNYATTYMNYWEPGTGSTVGIGNQIAGGNYQATAQYAQIINTQNWPGVVGGMASNELEVEIDFPLGKRTLTMKKKADGNRIKVSLEDIDAAIDGARDQFKFQIVTNRAERRAESLLQSMISEIDFRNYKQQGYFVCREGNKLFRIYKDKNKWVDMWEAKEVEAELIWQPKNRLCTHTATRELPDADEALSKLLLARSGRLIEHANLHAYDGTRGLAMPVLKHENELILVS